jgi:hypothetical protein
MSHLEVDEGDPKVNGCISWVFILFCLWLIGLAVYEVLKRKGIVV